jgi:hypothetical protein
MRKNFSKKEVCFCLWKTSSIATFTKLDWKSRMANNFEFQFVVLPMNELMPTTRDLINAWIYRAKNRKAGWTFARRLFQRQLFCHSEGGTSVFKAQPFRAGTAVIDLEVRMRLHSMFSILLCMIFAVLAILQSETSSSIIAEAILACFDLAGMCHLYFNYYCYLLWRTWKQWQKSQTQEICYVHGYAMAVLGSRLHFCTFLCRIHIYILS